MADRADVRLHVPAALIGDPARAAMLLELLGAGRRSVGDLARVAGVAPSTASAHVRAHADAGLVRTDRAGRQRLVRLAGADVARALDPTARRPFTRGCQDWTGRRPHLAGRLGRQVLDVFTGEGWLEPRPGSRAVRLTGRGERGLADLEAS